MATLYYNGIVNKDWNNLGNWWQNSTHTVPATSLPSSSDDVIVSARIAGNTGSVPTVVNFTFNNPQNKINFRLDITVTVTGTATFNNNTYNFGTVNGNVILNNAISNSTINGNVVLNNSSQNNGTINSNAIFNDSSVNYATVAGNGTFNNNSYNIGTVNGTATYNGFTGTNQYGYFVGGQLTPIIIYIRTNGDDDTGDGSESSPYLTAQKAFDVAIVGNGLYTLDFGVGNFGGVFLTQDWPARISVRGAGATQSFLGGINAQGVNFQYSEDGLGGYTVENAGDGYNVNIHGSGQNDINIGNIITKGGDGNGSYNGDLYNYGWNGSVGAGGDITLHDLTVGDLDSRSGVSNNYWDYVKTSGSITLNNVAAGNINASNRSYTFASFGSTGNGGDVSVTNSSVGNIISNGAGDGLSSGSGGTITIVDSACGNIYSSGDFAEVVPGSGGSVSLTNSTSGNIYCNGSWDARWTFGIYDPNSIIGPGGSVILNNSTSGNINCIGGSVDGIFPNSTGVVLIDSHAGDIDCSGAVPGVYWWYFDSNGEGGSVTITDSTSGDINLSGGTDGTTNGVSGVATYTSSSFNDDTVTGDAIFNNNSFNIGTVTGTITYNGFTGTNQYGTFLNGQLSRTFYFNGAVDNDWATLGNWWQDSSFTTQATSLPTSVDDVIASNSIIYNNSGSEPTVRNFTLTNNIGDAFLIIAITVTGNAAFYDSSYMDIAAILGGNATFNDNSYNNYGTITGNATFNDYSYNSGTVTGVGTFNDNSSNWEGTVNGNAVFNDSSSNYGGYVNSNATFNDSSINTGTVTGDATFNHVSYNDAIGTVNGDATFNDASYTIPGVTIGTVILGNRTPYPLRYGINNSNILGMI